jgi:cytoskeleton protein RodZ
VTVGETLSHARRTRGLSVDDVSADTRIRATLIYAIEEDRFEICGGAVYARGHIRSIARVVGVDAEPLIGEFDAARGVPAVVAAVASAQPTDKSVVARTERRGPNWTVATAAALVVICGVALALLLSNHPSHGAKAGGTTADKQTAGATNKAPGATVGTPPPAAPTIVPVSKATMTIRALRGETWLSVTTKTGTQLFQGTLGAGERKVFSSRHGLVYVIGNAPAVDVVVNGNDIGAPPSTNAVARGTLRPGAATVHQA